MNSRRTYSCHNGALRVVAVSCAPSNAPTSNPTESPTPSPTLTPTRTPSVAPTRAPTEKCKSVQVSSSNPAIAGTYHLRLRRHISAWEKRGDSSIKILQSVRSATTFRIGSSGTTIYFRRGTTQQPESGTWRYESGSLTAGHTLQIVFTCSNTFLPSASPTTSPPTVEPTPVALGNLTQTQTNLAGGNSGNSGNSGNRNSGKGNSGNNGRFTRGTFPPESSTAKMQPAIIGLIVLGTCVAFGFIYWFRTSRRRQRESADVDAGYDVQDYLHRPSFTSVVMSNKPDEADQFDGHIIKRFTDVSPATPLSQGDGFRTSVVTDDSSGAPPLSGAPVDDSIINTSPDSDDSSSSSSSAPSPPTYGTRQSVVSNAAIEAELMMTPVRSSFGGKPPTGADEPDTTEMVVLDQPDEYANDDMAPPYDAEAEDLMNAGVEESADSVDSTSSDEVIDVHMLEG